MANWIDDATEGAHGQFAAKAKAAGMTTHAYAEQHKTDKGKLGKQARLALTLMGMGKRKTMMGGDDGDGDAA